MSDKNKYPGVDARDTGWDDFHRKRGMMTNREFFSSNGKGGFYEGMEYENGQWVPNAERREAEYQKEKANECSECGKQKPYCDCY